MSDNLQVGQVLEMGNWRSTRVFDEGREAEVVGAYILPDGSTQPFGSPAIAPHWTWELKIKATDTGNYIWCDCSYECLHCKECIGCIRKLVFDWDTHEFREEHVRCPASPTGWHETTEEGDEDDE